MENTQKSEKEYPVIVQFMQRRSISKYKNVRKKFRSRIEFRAIHPESRRCPSNKTTPFGGTLR